MIEPDNIIHEGIKVLQQKVAALIHGLGENDGMDGEYDGPRSPEGLDGGAPWQDQGYTTPYAGAGNASAWGGGGATAYGTTPYGNSGSGGGW